MHKKKKVPRQASLDQWLRNLYKKGKARGLNMPSSSSSSSSYEPPRRRSALSSSAASSSSSSSAPLNLDDEDLLADTFGTNDLIQYKN